jgi:mannose-1-phosphate guanylyltransferase
MIAVVGLEDVIVIDTSDAILICKKGSSQNVQAVVDYLRRKKINSLL